MNQVDQLMALLENKEVVVKGVGEGENDKWIWREGLAGGKVNIYNFKEKVNIGLCFNAYGK